jgi:hypothetical protein
VDIEFTRLLRRDGRRNQGQSGDRYSRKKFLKHLNSLVESQAHCTRTK